MRNLAEKGVIIRSMENNIDISRKVHQLKSSFTVEGTPLFKSNRFSDEEIAQMQKENDCHPSHWLGLLKNNKAWSDEEIATQIEVFYATPAIPEQKFKDIVNKLLSSLPINDIVEERKAFRETLFGVLNWTEEKNGVSEMWRKFGSAPSAKGGGFHGNKKLEKYSKMYGACSMHEVFDGQFSDKFHVFWYGVNHALHQFEEFWKEAKRKKELKAQTFISPYNTLDELEDNVVVKKMSEAAKTFYMDETKDFSERVNVFSKYGKAECSIHQPTDANLAKIFNMHLEGDWLERHQVITCADIVYGWVNDLKTKRCKLNWSNHYHPKLEKTNRNYVPSEEAINRLYRYYIEKLFLEEIGSFEFDW